MSRHSFETRRLELETDAAKAQIALRGERHFTIEDIEILERKISNMKEDGIYAKAAAFVIGLFVAIIICIVDKSV
jgi:hypothetical protein